MFDDQKFDSRIGIFAESIARKLNRRKLVANGVKGLFGTVAGVALGQLVNIQQAFASGCDTCNWAYGHHCSGCPGYAGCPSGYAVCTSSSGCGTICNYPNGQWTVCTIPCSCSTGFRVCTDCRTNGCGYICTCLSGRICCSQPCCSTPEGVHAEMQRLAALQA